VSSLYVTATEFTNWPTGLDLQNLIPGGTTQENAAQLAVMVQAASQFVEQIVYQRLYACQDTETKRVRPQPDGTLLVVTDQFPITEIGGVPAYLAPQWRWGSYAPWMQPPSGQVTVTGPRTYVLDDRYYATPLASQPLTVMTTYVHGWPNALLTSSATQGATTLQVDDATGMQAGQTVGALTLPGTSLTVYDIEGGQETVTVASVSGNSVTLAAGTLYAHAAGVRISALPFAVSEAAIHLCEWQIKGRRAGGGISMDGTLQPMQLGEAEDVQNAMRLLRPYKRVI